MELTPEREAEIKAITLERLRKTKGDQWVEDNATYLENEWEYIRELGLIDPDVDWTKVPL